MEDWTEPGDFGAWGDYDVLMDDSADAKREVAELQRTTAAVQQATAAVQQATAATEQLTGGSATSAATAAVATAEDSESKKMMTDPIAALQASGVSTPLAALQRFVAAQTSPTPPPSPLFSASTLRYMQRRR